MNTVLIVQARMTSTRLPGKVMMPILGRPLLKHQIERLLRINIVDTIMVATTTNDSDQPIADLCTKLHIPYYRGSEEDVLSRFVEASKIAKADVIVRITSDCPLIDPQIIERVVGFYLDNQMNFDYVSNCLRRSYPRGMDTEVFSSKLLYEINKEAQSKTEREHVTPFIYQNPGRYRLGNVASTVNLGHYRLTVDTQEDFELITKLYEALYPENPRFSLEDIVQTMETNPEWYYINAHIEQKKIEG